jgi:proteic killer suppression protein
VIASFRHNALKRLWETNNHRGIDSRYARAIRRRLESLDEATVVGDLDIPGNGLHPLQPPTARRWAITVSRNWRITFRFEDGNAYEVDLEDYH